MSLAKLARALGLVGEGRLAYTKSHVARIRASLAGRAELWDIGPWDFAFLGLMAAAFALVLSTYRDYGITWDEVVQDNYGALILKYYTSLFRDLSATQYIDLYNYGGLFDFPVVALTHISPLDHFETRHLVNALVGLFGVAGCWRLARTVAGPRVGCLAAALLLATPSWYGHMFNNPKDIPFAALFAWALAAAARCLRDLPAINRRHALAFGVWAGLDCAVRIGAVVLFAYLVTLAIVVLVARRDAFADRRRVVAQCARATLELGLMPGLLAFVVMLPFWPYAQLSPLLNPLRALAFFAAVPESIPVEFEGHLISSLAVPPDYLPVMLGLKLPELVIFLLPLGCIVAAREAYQRAPRLWPRDAALLMLAILFPLAFIALAGSDMFDGIRHVLFVLPPLACLAAIGLDGAIHALSRTPRPFRYAAGLLLGAYTAVEAALLFDLHPYETVYYNAFAGGVSGAAHGFDLDYWGNSFRDDGMWLVTDLRHLYGPSFAKRTFHVVVCGPETSLQHFLPPNVMLTPKVEDADFAVALNRAGWDKCAPGPIVHRVERLGALLSLVVDRRAQRAAAAARGSATVSH